MRDELATQRSGSYAHQPQGAEKAPHHLRIQPLGPTYAAYGAVLDLLTRYAPFAGFRLDQASAIIRAQLKSGNHVAVFTPDDRLVGYLGWVYTSTAAAELWMKDLGELEATPNRGEALVVTVVVSTAPLATGMLLRRCRELHPGLRGYFQRLYAEQDRQPKKQYVQN